MPPWRSPSPGWSSNNRGGSPPASPAAASGSGRSASRAYTGTYVSRLYGTLTITIEEGVLAARIGNLHAVSTPYTAPNTIRVEFVPFRGEVIGFELGDDGKAVRARYDNAMYEREE